MTRRPDNNSWDSHSGGKKGERRREECLVAETQKALRALAAKGFLKDVGSGLLSHMTLCSIIDDGELNFQVRNGIGCTLSSMATNKVVKYIIDREGRSFFHKQAARAISTGQLSTSPRLHLQPIDRVVYPGPSALSRGELILRQASRLDAFSGYPFRT